MNKQEQIEKMKQILKENGIEMQVGGCGCCGSPWITFNYKGEEIIDDNACSFDTKEIITK